MKLLPLGLLVCAAAMPLRAQNLFVVLEDDGVHYPVKAVENKRPLIIVHGQPRSARSDTFSLAKAPIFGLGTIDLSAFKIEITTTLSSVGQPQLHVYGRLRADQPLAHCFFVVRLATDMGKSVICDALPDLAPGRDAVYDSLFDLPPRGIPLEGKFNVLIFSNGLQLTTSQMSPGFIAAQRAKTVQYLREHAPR
jgi:hypothetical protein